ncbi:uncharacterized protein A1O5_07337, partial [Cladophialophora psammophila CBS 110553]
ADGERTKRPIIFVAHSLGGIICKTALLLLYSEGARAWETKAARSVAESTLGIMFFWHATHGVASGPVGNNIAVSSIQRQGSECWSSCSTTQEQPRLVGPSG